MARFEYRTKRQMDPKPGNKFATEYYKQTPGQRTRLKDFVDTVYDQWSDRCARDPEARRDSQRPLTGFPRTQGPNYSAQDIITDLHNQLRSGKDLPSGMLGRWNRLFKNSEYTIEMTTETVAQAQARFGELFESQRNNNE